MLELKPRNVDRKAYKGMLLQHVIPEIMAKWPEQTPWNIKMQHDNAQAHLTKDDADVVAAGYRIKRTRITLEAQPQNSPNFNILDLWLFAGVQPLQYQAVPRKVEELIEAVKKAYKEYDAQPIDDNFLTLLKCMECAMDIDDGNGYKLPQMRKQQHRLAETPIRDVYCNEATYNRAIEAIERAIQ